MPCGDSASIRVWLLGAGPGENVDFARFSFQVPTTASAASAVPVPIAMMAPTRRVLILVCMGSHEINVEGAVLSEVARFLFAPRTADRSACASHAETATRSGLPI